MTHGLVIVGGSYAAMQLAASARDQGYDAPITLIGEETSLPYQRPPLSKGILTGKTQTDQLALRSEAFYQEACIDLVLHQRVTHIDQPSQSIMLEDGTIRHYDHLALTTGARPRPLSVPGASLKGVLPVRSLDDALMIKSRMPFTQKACVIGGGFIGLEVASALAANNIDVTVLEAQPRLLSRSFPPVMSTYIQDVHQQHGVHIRCNTQVQALHGENGEVTSVMLTDGTMMDCQLVIVGIGVIPNNMLAVDAGLDIDPVNQGILTDGCGRTSSGRIFAIGDVASAPVKYASPPYAQRRLESVQAANDGAKAAASALVGKAAPCESVPWFWSDQYNLKFQMAGLYTEEDEVVMRGNLTENKFTVFYLRQGIVVAAHSVNQPSEHMLSRKLIAAQCALLAEQLRDKNFDLKSVL